MVCSEPSCSPHVAESPRTTTRNSSGAFGFDTTCEANIASRLPRSCASSTGERVLIGKRARFMCKAAYTLNGSSPGSSQTRAASKTAKNSMPLASNRHGLTAFCMLALYTEHFGALRRRVQRKGEHEMKHLVVIVIGVALTVAACSAVPGAAAPGDLLPVESPTASLLPPTPTHIPVDLSPAQRAAISALAQSLGISVDQVRLMSSEAVTWPNGCMGVQRIGVMCTQAQV